MRGSLVLVVGPSGAGKDTLIAEARKRLAGNPRYVFPSRVITRHCEPGSEIHDSATDEAFEKMVAAGAFCLHWRAHGLRYGIPASAGHAISQGRIVIVNLSRGMVDAARKRFSSVRIINVTASPETLHARLHARKRASDGNPADRLSREVALPDDIATIENGGSLNESVAAFLNEIGKLPADVTKEQAQDAS